MQAPTSEKKIQLCSDSGLRAQVKDWTNCSVFLGLQSIWNKISPVLVSPTTTNQDQQWGPQTCKESITLTSFCRGTSALLDPLSPSLCCLHPCHRKELWKVFQLCSNSICLPNSSGLTTVLLWIRGAGGCLFLPVPAQNRRLLLFFPNHRGAGDFFGSFGLLGML